MSSAAPEPAGQVVYAFERFRLDAQRRMLFGADGEPIPLTPRLLDTLLYFVERAGQLLPKEQLLEAIWPRVVVEEHNLNKIVSELRRVLGEKPGEHKFIVTKPGHGYRFVASVSVEARAEDTRRDQPLVRTDEIKGTGAAPQRAASSARSKRHLVLMGSTAAVALAAIGAWVVIGDGNSSDTRNAATTESVARNSVAVLPFADHSADGEQSWLADGLAEGILNSLARLPDLKVTARTSSFQFRDASDVREVAGRLGVENLVEGSVQTAGDNLRVTAQLIHAGDGVILWSSTYDGVTSDLFAFQRNVAEGVASALDVVLDESSRAALFASGTSNVEAFREYQRGWQVYNFVHGAQTRQTLWDANRHFERALTLDPRFGLAAVGRADAFIHFLIGGPMNPFAPNSPYSREDALEQLRETLGSIADSSPTATMRLAYQIQSESYSRTWERMPFLLDELRRQWDVSALTFGSGVDSALWIPHILWATGQNDLVRVLAEHHVTNDPLSADAWARKVGVELHARDFDAARDALVQARRSLGPSSLLNEELRMALLEHDRGKAIEVLQLFANQEAAMVMASLNADRAAALAIADVVEKRFSELPPGAFLGGLLYTYYELGDVERSNALVERIDESPVGPQIFMMLLAVNGGARYFDLAHAPNFAAKLARARVDALSLPQMTRLSTLP